MSNFRKFVTENERWYLGRFPVTDEKLDAVEAALSLRLPVDFRWLLIHYGHWHATGISSLEESVEGTLAARQHLGLPPHHFVLYDRGDCGVHLLDCIPDPNTGEHVVWDVAWEDIPDRIMEGIRFESLVEFGKDRIDFASTYLDEGDIDYDPSDYPDDRPGSASV